MKSLGRREKMSKIPRLMLQLKGCMASTHDTSRLRWRRWAFGCRLGPCRDGDAWADSRSFRIRDVGDASCSISC